MEEIRYSDKCCDSAHLNLADLLGGAKVALRAVLVVTAKIMANFFFANFPPKSNTLPAQREPVHQGVAGLEKQIQLN